MAEEMGDLYYHQPFQDQRHGGFLYSNTQQQQISSMAESSLLHNLDHPFISFTDYLHGSSDFGLSSSPPPPPPSFSSGEHQPPVNDTPVVMTPNSSISSSSTEAAGDNNDDSKNNKKDKQAKETLEDGEDSSKKENNKGKKKGEKKQKQPRFAFMTKSEVDHLEDGYRWRKYGQKAVKNSPYPRSYYRCTSQKCQVKKRVERSYQDPSIVITTYEGQHDHHIPTNLRGSIAGMFPASMLSTSSLLGGPPELMAQMNHPLHHHHLYGGSTVMHQQNNNNSSNNNNNYYNNITQEMQQQLQALHPDYGLLQDVVPSMIFKQEP